jgi:hypothetical protein
MTKRDGQGVYGKVFHVLTILKINGHLENLPLICPF